MTDIQKHILIVDDDQRLRDLLRRYLGNEGYHITAVGNTNDMDSRLLRDHFHLLILDLMLPGEDGLSACKRLRTRGNNIPIIMLTAKGDEVDRIVGLELGADDYLPKPFNPRELLARINAVLRRKPETAATNPDADNKAVCFGQFRLDPATRTLYRNDTIEPLSSGLFALLKVLASNPWQPVSRARLSELLNERSYDGSVRNIDIQISRLRQLIETDPKTPRYLQTVRGIGYVFVPDEQADEQEDEQAQDKS